MHSHAMEDGFESRYHQFEETHWWFVARRDMIMRLLRDESRESKILDIGCSAGALLRELVRAGFVNARGIDKSKKAVEFCKAGGQKNVSLMDGARMGFGDAEFDLLIASNVLEHIENDRTALSEWHRVLKPGGRLLVFVPAFSFPWSGHDEANMHYRRYNRGELASKLRDGGFSIERSSYWNAATFLPALAARLPQRLLRLKGHDDLHGQPMLNGPLIRLLRFENAIAERVPLPFGVSFMSL